MHKEHFMIGMMLMLVAACGDSGDENQNLDPRVPVPDAGLIDGDTETMTVDGLYTVPVDDASLSPFASQPVVLDWGVRDGQYRLDYDFPVELTGISQRVSFEGQAAQDGSIELVGDLGSASCNADLASSRFVCTERFPQLQFDLERLQRDFEQRGLPATEIARRLQVASIFQSDPIGILSFSLD